MSNKSQLFEQVAIASQKASRNFFNQTYKLALLPWILLCFCSHIALAKPPISSYQAQKPDPNEERFLQPQPPASPLPEEEVAPRYRFAPGREENSNTILVKTVIVSGTSIFEEDDLANIIQPLLNRNVSLQELQEAADAITQRYLERGYITSRAIFDPNKITPDGTVTIQVVEGSLEAIEIKGNQRLKESYIRSRLELGTKPLNTSSLEYQLRLLHADPLLDDLTVILRTSSNPSQSILVVRVTERDHLVTRLLLNENNLLVGSKASAFERINSDIILFSDALSLHSKTSETLNTADGNVERILIFWGTE